VVYSPALVAHLPLIQTDEEAGAPAAPGAEMQATGPVHPPAGYAPAFVESTVTEFAGPGLRIHTSLQVRVDDRVLVVFRLGGGSDAGRPRQRVVAAIGRVKHGVGIPDAIDRVWDGSSPRDLHALAAQPLSIAVQLMGLSNEEIDELASLANELSSPAPEYPGDKATAPQETLTHEMTAT